MAIPVIAAVPPGAPSLAIDAELAAAWLGAFLRVDVLRQPLDT